ncbi:MAG: hypothetical protein V1875_08760 [Candidatus Altiarchaeota archaeon]
MRFFNVFCVVVFLYSALSLVEGACSPDDCTDTIAYTCKNGDVYKVTIPHQCVNDTCETGATDEALFDDCGTGEVCQSGQQACVVTTTTTTTTTTTSSSTTTTTDPDWECSSDSDCSDDPEYFCKDGNVWKRTFLFDCDDHECIKDDEDEEEYKKCKSTEYCDDEYFDEDEHSCTKGTTTTLYFLTTTSFTTTTERPTTTTHRREEPITTSTQPRPVVTTLPTTTSTTSSTTTTSSTSTTTTLAEASLMDKILFESPVELVLDAINYIFHVIIFWD